MLVKCGRCNCWQFSSPDGFCITCERDGPKQVLIGPHQWSSARVGVKHAGMQGFKTECLRCNWTRAEFEAADDSVVLFRDDAENDRERPWVPNEPLCSADHDIERELQFRAGYMARNDAFWQAAFVRLLAGGRAFVEASDDATTALTMWREKQRTLLDHDAELPTRKVPWCARCCRASKRFTVCDKCESSDMLGLQ